MQLDSEITDEVLGSGRSPRDYLRQAAMAYSHSIVTGYDKPLFRLIVLVKGQHSYRQIYRHLN